MSILFMQMWASLCKDVYFVSYFAAIHFIPKKSQSMMSMETRYIYKHVAYAILE